MTMPRSAIQLLVVDARLGEPMGTVFLAGLQRGLPSAKDASEYGRSISSRRSRDRDRIEPVSDWVSTPINTLVRGGQNLRCSR